MSWLSAIPPRTMPRTIPENWQTLELTWHPDFAAGRSETFTVHRGTDEVALGAVPSCPAEVGSVVDL